MRIWWPAQRAGSETVMMTKAPSPLDSDFALEQILRFAATVDAESEIWRQLFARTSK